MEKTQIVNTRRRGNVHGSHVDQYYAEVKGIRGLSMVPGYKL